IKMGRPREPACGKTEARNRERHRPRAEALRDYPPNIRLRPAVARLGRGRRRKTRKTAAVNDRRSIQGNRDGTFGFAPTIKAWAGRRSFRVALRNLALLSQHLCR